MIKLIPINGVKTNEIDSLDEWIKWLEYDSPKSIDKINEVFYKSMSSLSMDEVNILKEYVEEKRMLRLIKKYKSDNYTEREGQVAFSYMVHHDINDLMNKKLDESSFYKVNNILDNYYDNDKRPKGYDNYNNLSIEEAYALRYIINDENLNRLRKKMEGKVYEFK